VKSDKLSVQSLNKSSLSPLEQAGGLQPQLLAVIFLFTNLFSFRSRPLSHYEPIAPAFQNILRKSHQLHPYIFRVNRTSKAIPSLHF
jgi:hypothetical protein